MCAAAVEGQQATWITVNIADDSAGSVSVKYGRFTGQTMTTGKGVFPAKLPRYIIEAVQDTEAGGKADDQTKYIFRITAVGFGLIQMLRWFCSLSTEKLLSHKICTTRVNIQTLAGELI
jgi:Tfp pilus assembly protein PilX